MREENTTRLVSIFTDSAGLITCAVNMDIERAFGGSNWVITSLAGSLFTSKETDLLTLSSMAFESNLSDFAVVHSQLSSVGS